MSQLTVDIPDDLVDVVRQVAANHCGADELAPQGLLLLAAAKLYDMGRLSSGAAARLAGVPRVEFLNRLSDYDVPAFRQSASELEQDLRNARRGR